MPVLEEHFAFLRRRFDVVLPGEPLRPGRLSVCLSFDDGYADFYAHVFPLLEKFSLRALLAVPTAFILPETVVPMAERLSVTQSEAMQGELFQTRAPFCTWEELRRMVSSGRVQIASHSHRHLDLRRDDVDVEFEAAHSKSLLEQNLGCRISTFVYPFGSVNARAHSTVMRHYSFALRVGSALNSSWRPYRQPLCRVGADETPDLARRLHWHHRATYALKWGANLLRAARGKWQPRPAPGTAGSPG
ncbi:MAG TPA: polysaccharide deacetylase family protein [Verrucomicrobiae bacterium]|nr:polysaccharide deacetylase family protein [Verrucomicrobiae bacterium]